MYKNLRNKRTGVDFSKHVVLESHFKNENHNVDIWDLKLPNSEYTHRVTFINSCGVLTVNGDFGRWSFCREFHPSEDGYVSTGYWAEKLNILSEQTSSKYDSERTREALKELIKSGLEDYGYSGDELKKYKSAAKELLKYSDDELEYTYEAYRNSELDYDIIPFVKSTHQWLLVVYDAFEELCERMSVTHPQNID